MTEFTRGDAAYPRSRHAARLSPAVLHFLGELLCDAYELGDLVRFGGLLSRLDAASACDDGDDMVFRADLLRFMPNMRRFAFSLARDEAAADDIVQDALLRAWRGRAGFSPGTNLQAWLLTITRNAFLSSLRTNGRELGDIDGERAARLTVTPEQGGHVDLADVRKAVAGLPSGMREALMLVTVGDMPYEDAAAILGCRIGTVKSRVWRARHRLARMLGYDGSEIGGDGLMLAAASTTMRKNSVSL